jgi:hypothetical protein
MDWLKRAAKKLGIVTVILCVGMTALSCGQDGKIYGAVVCDDFWYLGSVGGFPGTFYEATYYEVSAGTYDVYYNLWDGAAYYPGPTSLFYFYATYSVEAEKGSFPLVDGEDRNFALYLSYFGMAKAGDVSAIKPQQRISIPMTDTMTWTENGVRVKVTNRIVELSPQQIANLAPTHLKK